MIIQTDKTHPRRQYSCLKYVGCKRYLLNMVVLILRFLASGNYQISISFSCRIAPSIVHSINVSTCEAIWNRLSRTVLPQPTGEEWKKKQNNFIHYGSSLTALELLMANTLKY